jgi:hypothetical protein
MNRNSSAAVGQKWAGRSAVPVIGKDLSTEEGVSENGAACGYSSGRKCSPFGALTRIVVRG